MLETDLQVLEKLYQEAVQRYEQALEGDVTHQVICLTLAFGQMRAIADCLLNKKKLM